MAITIDSTPNGENANSYISIEDANTYYSYHLYASAWDDADLETQIKALIMSTRILDENFQWLGSRTTTTQALGWGRTDVEYDGEIVDSLTVPKAIQNATAEFTRHLLVADLTDEPDGKGLNKLEVGSVKLSFDKRDTATVLPTIVQGMLVGWYENIYVNQSFGVADAIRN